MKKVYPLLFCLLLIIAGISGCKVDDPVFPEGFQTKDGTGAGETNNGGATNGSFINYKIDGAQNVSLTSNVFFQVIAKDMLPPDGNIQIAAGADISNSFSLTAGISATGTAKADIIVINNKYVGEGNVTFTEVNTTNQGVKGTVKGSFTGTVVDPDTEQEKAVSGTFSIKQ